MNKFRNNLHSAFFTGGNGNGSAEYYRPEEEMETPEQVEKQTRQELDDAKAEVVDNPNFSNVVDVIIKEKRGEKKYLENKKRFKERRESPNSEGKKYEEVWNEKIKQGFIYLKGNLEDRNYFAGCTTPQQKNSKMAQVEAKYFNQVKLQYIRNIWEASDDDFNKIKDTIFDANSEGNPSDRVLNALTQEGATVTRVKYEGSAIDKVGTGEDVETEKRNKRIRFLAHDLPDYLWNTRSVNGAAKLVLRTNIPTDVDKKQIENFIKIVDKLNVEGSEVKAELKLLELFDSLQDASTEDDIIKALENNKFSLKNGKAFSENKHFIKNIKQMFDFYVQTQGTNNDYKNQHLMYIYILEVIKTEGGFDETMAAYQSKVDAYKDRIKTEKKEGYAKGKELNDEEFKAYAEKLGITDYTILTRLNKKSDDYFDKTATVDILADLNNDGELNPTDKLSTKTGIQFKELYKTVTNILGEEGEDKVLSNLLGQAKIVNLTLPQDMQLKEEEFDAAQIKAGNKKLILMLQSIIAKPGQDLYTLMLYGPDAMARQAETYNTLKNLPDSIDDPEVQKATTDLLTRYGITPDTDLGDDLNYDGLYQATAGALLMGYRDAVDAKFKQGTGAGTQISLDEWVKGLSLNLGVQATDDGKLGFGFTIAYSRTFQLNNGNYIRQGFNCGFVMCGIIPGFVAGGSTEIGKEWINKSHVAQKIALVTGAEYSSVKNTLTFSAIGKWSKDKVRGVEQSVDKIKEAFNNEVITPLLDKIAEKFGDNEFDLTQPDNIKLVKDAVDEIINKILSDKKSEFKKEDLEQVKENTVRLLTNYNNAPINNSNVRKYIAGELSEAYASIWAEDKFAGISDKIYVSGLRAGVSVARMVGTIYCVPIVHLGISLTKHRKDGYGDVSKRKYETQFKDGSNRTQELIDDYNTYLGDEKLSLTEDGRHIILSKNLIRKYNILLNPGMKGLMKKDESGNVLLSTETYMNYPDITEGGATKSTVIIIGGKTGQLVRLDEIMNSNDWFTTNEIDVGKLPGKEIMVTRQKIDETLDKLKKEEAVQNDQVLQNFKFNDEFYGQFKPKGQKYKITLNRENNSITTSVTEVNEEGPSLQIEYIGTDKVELMDKDAQRIADAAYLEARKVKTNALRNISHDKNNKLYPEYKKFAQEMRDKNYQAAKDTIIKLLPKMEDHINGRGAQKNNKVDFRSFVVPELQKIKSDVALGQALLSINNVFARVATVQGGVGENEKDDKTYHFVHWEGNEKVATPMGDIIKTRAGQIKTKINQSKASLGEDITNSYTSLIDAMEDYRQKNPDYYSATSKNRKRLDNAVGINLGNAINIENPLFNPEIYEGSEIQLSELNNFKGKDALQQHAMEVMAHDKSLMGPILTALGVDLPQATQINYTVDSYDASTGTLTISIDGKKVKFSADMSVGYFSQCVNHMILLKNIQAEIEGGGAKVKLQPGVSGGGSITETVVRTVMASATADIDVSRTIPGGAGEPAPNTNTNPNDRQYEPIPNVNTDPSDRGSFSYNK